MGIDWSAVPLRINRAGTTVSAPGYRVRPDFFLSIEDLDFWCVWAGGARLRRGVETIELRPGVCLLLRPGLFLELEVEGGSKLGVSWVHFDPSERPGGPRRLPAEEELPPLAIEVSQVNYFASAARRISALTDFADRADADVSDSAKREAVLLLRSLLLAYEREAAGGDGPPGRPADQRYRSAISQMVARMHDDPRSIANIPQMAKEIGYHPDHFTRIFKRVTGQTPASLLLQAKTEKAKELLLETDWTVGMVASRLGYENVFYFSKQFKDRTGMSPTAFRARRQTR